MDIVLYIAGAIITIAGASKILMRALAKSIQQISEKTVNTAVMELNDRFSNQLKDVEDSLRELLEENRRSDKMIKILTVKNSAARIHEGYSHYMRRGSITTFGLANLEEIYEIYEGLNQNGYTKLCMEQIRQLPIVDVHPLPADKVAALRKKEKGKED